MFDLAALTTPFHAGSALWPALWGAGLAGFVGSPHCVGMCGGFAVAAAGTGDKEDRSLLDASAWTLGRLSTYAILGGIAGSVGALVPGPGWVGTALAAAMLVWFAGRLAGVVQVDTARLPFFSKVGGRLLRRTGLGARFAFGAVNGLLPCGLVYAALAFPVAAGDPVSGALAMVAFGLGTVPALGFAVVGLRRITAASIGARRALALAVLVFGLGTLALRGDFTTPGSWRTTADAECH